MKAVQLTAVGAPLEIRDVPRPVPKDNEVLVQVAGCGVCHTDIGFWKDGVPTNKPLPLTLGHEVSGTIVEAGFHNADLVGRRVIVPAVIPCGSCDLCRGGRGNVCRKQVMPGNDADGGFAEFMAAPGRGLCLVDDLGPYDLAELSVIADAVTTPFQAVVRSGLVPGDLAIVIGVGGVGTYAAQIAAAFGAHVIAIDVDAQKLAAIAEHGVEHTINAAKADFKAVKKDVKDTVKKWSAKEHSWKIFECSGTAAGQSTAFGLLTHAATLMVVGFTLEKTELRLSNAMAFDATIQGTWGCKPELYPEALGLIIKGKIALTPFVERHPMSQGPSIVERVAKHEIPKRVILEPDWTS